MPPIRQKIKVQPNGQVFQKLTPQKRVDLAKKHLEKLVDILLEVIAIHETNRHLVYSQNIADQIPPSDAAVAYNTLQRSMYNFELLRLASIWDSSDSNKSSIATIIALIDEPDVLKYLEKDTIEFHANSQAANWTPEPDPSLQKLVDEMFASSQRQFGEEQAKKAMKSLQRVIRKAREVFSDYRFGALRLVRDKHIAHNLRKASVESKQSVARLKFGDEKYLLKEAIVAIEKMFLWVNGASFDISRDSYKYAAKRADDLWLNCKFDFKKQF